MFKRIFITVQVIAVTSWLALAEAVPLPTSDKLKSLSLNLTSGHFQSFLRPLFFFFLALHLFQSYILGLDRLSSPHLMR